MSVDPLSWLVSLEGVPSAFAATRDGIDALLRDRGLRRTSPEQTGTSLLRGAHASAVLEGSTSSWEEVEAGAGDTVAADAVRLSTEVLSQVPVLGRAPLQALARLHAVASATEHLQGEVGAADAVDSRDALCRFRRDVQPTQKHRLTAGLWWR